MNQQLDKDIEEYQKLTNMKRALEERLSSLNKRIKKSLTKMTTTPGEAVKYYGVKGITVEMTPRKRRKYDQGLVEQLFTDKNLYTKYVDLYIPDSAVEEAYLNEDLTDSDLRKLFGEAEISLALSVKETEKENV